jgi:hypothetical protein
MSNNRKSIISGIVGILLILIAVRDVLSTLDGVLLISGVILLALGATIADRDRDLLKKHQHQELMEELHNSVEGDNEPA